MGMSRKHYVLIASAIDQATCPDDPSKLFKEQLIEGLCRIMKADSGLFDAKKFEDACRLTEIIDESSGS